MEAKTRLYVDVYMVILAVISVAYVIWHEISPFSPQVFQVIAAVDLAIVLVFLGEWSWGMARAANRTAYFKDTWYDLPGLIPMYVGGAAGLRGLRLLRLFRLLRLYRALRVYREVKKISGVDLFQALRSSRIGYTAGITAGIILVGSTAVWLLERMAAEPRITSWGEALWWGVVTTTTVGYGDITPVTPGGRIVAGLLMLVGVGLIGVLASTISAALISQRETADRARLPLSAGGGLTGDLERLANLRERGHLTEEEFLEVKDRILRS